VAPPKRGIPTPVKILLAVAGLGVLAIGALIVAAIAIPGLLRARMTSNETAAITTLHVIAAAQAKYAAACGNGGYADSLARLAISDQEKGTGDAPQIAALAAGPSQGYVFVVGAGKDAESGPTDCKGRPTTSAWYTSAVPMTFGTTGMRSFATNGSATVWSQPEGSPPREPFGPPAVPIR